MQLAGHNALVVIALVLGGLMLGAPTLLLLILNGASVGLTASAALQSVPPLHVLLAIAPHGLVEIPAALIAGAAGFRLAQGAHHRVCGKPVSVPQVATETLTATALALCLVGVAAPLERFVSLHLTPAATMTG